MCTSGQVCSQGACSAGCSGGETLCGGAAEAGAPEAGAAGDSSTSGDDGGSDAAQADTGASPVVDSGSGIGGGDAGAPYCANLNSDPANCGGCGIVCGGACTNGACATPTCPAGQVGCPASGTCIPTGTCCNSGECTITGEVCPMPGGQCQCPSGETECKGALMSCISTSACCTNSDCTVAGQTCTTPGQACTCKAGLQCCVGTDCASEPNVMSAACTANKCVASCTAGCYDLNSTYTDGCECCDDTYGKTCATATATTATLSVGQSVAYTGQIPEPTGGDWFTVTFTGSTNTAYHPTVTFTSNPTKEFLFDITVGSPASCPGTAVSCASGEGTGTGLTTWEQSYTGPNPPADPAHNFVPIPEIGQVLIHVYRASTTNPATCDQFALTISE